jgi:hypothetical protein
MLGEMRPVAVDQLVVGLRVIGGERHEAQRRNGGDDGRPPPRLRCLQLVLLAFVHLECFDTGKVSF